jgi:hypothetical protein
MCLSCYRDYCGLIDGADPGSNDPADIAWAPVSAEMRSLAVDVAAFREMPECTVGGPIHVEIDDDNLDDDFMPTDRARFFAERQRCVNHLTGEVYVTYSDEVMEAAWSIMERFSAMTEPERATVQAIEYGVDLALTDAI